MIKYVIFDFDGTLVDSKNVFVSVYNQLADKHGFNQIKKSEIDYLRKLPIKERGKHLNFPVYKLPLFAAEFNRLYKESIKELQLFSGIRELLAGLHKRGYQLAIISSNSEENIEAFCRNNKITNFNEIVSEKHFFGKDKSINKFMKRNKLHHSEIVYVGDEVRDIIAAQKSNVKMIWVDWGYDLVEQAERNNPDHIVSSPKEILQIV